MTAKRHTFTLLVFCLISSAFAQPVFEDSSATAGSDSSHEANQIIDKGMYKEVQYANTSKRSRCW